MGIHSTIIRRVCLVGDKPLVFIVDELLVTQQLTLSTAIAGYVADHIQSRRAPLLAGLPVLILSTALLYVGDSLALWIIGRILQGMSAAVTWTVGLALLVDTVEKEHLGQTLGYMSTGMMIGTTAGPLLGGIIYQVGGYHSVFAAVFALIALDVILRLVLIERKHAVQWLDTREASSEDPSPDPTSTEPLLKTSVQQTSCDYGATEGPSTSNDGPVSDPENTGEGTAKPQQATIISLLTHPHIALGLWAYFITSIALTSFDSVLPLFVRDTFDWHQLGQGLIFLPISVSQIFDPAVGAICDKFPKARHYIAACAFGGAAVFLASIQIVTHDSLAQKVWLCALLGLLGLCISFAISPILLIIDDTLEAMEKESPDRFSKGGAVAQAYGLVSSAFAAGALIGPVFAGFVRHFAGWGAMTWCLGIVNAITGVMIWAWGN